jgi:hypothetical protein
LKNGTFRKMATNDLFNYMRDATHQMQSEYERIQKRAAEDPGTAGDNGEENWAELLRNWIPSYYPIVTKGRIMNSEGNCSPQVDILILSPSYPKALIGKKEYLEGGVVAAFECKLTLKAEHIKGAVRNAVKIHRLSEPIEKGTPYKELQSRIRYGLLAHSHVWKGKDSSPMENIERNWHETEIDEADHPREEIDVVCVSDLATWNTGKMVIAGEHLLSQLEIRYNSFGEVWDFIKEDCGLIETFHSCFAEIHEKDEEKKKLFTPIGSFLTKVIEMLAWEDVNLRLIAEFFIQSQMLGSGYGKCKVYPLSLLSEELREKLRKGGCIVNGERWHEWQMLF